MFAPLSERSVARCICGYGLVACALLVAAVSGLGCKKATNPNGKLHGNVVLAAGQTGDVNQTAVELFTGDPFAPGATPVHTTVASGTATDATFTFGSDVPHGDFYILAWKDGGNGVLDAGDLEGWYDGATTGGGAPSPVVLHLLHGEDKSITLQVSVKP